MAIELTGEVITNNELVLTGEITTNNAITLSGDITANIVLAKVNFARILGDANDNTNLAGHLSTKVDKVEGKGLSTNDYTNADKSKVATAVQPADISDMATKTWTNAQGFLKEHQSLANYDTKAEVNTKDQAVKDWADGKFLTEHQSLANYDTKEEVNSKISTATNDMATKTWVGNQGYLTEHQSLSAYRTSANQDIIDNAIKADVDAIEELIPGQATSSNKLADKEFVNSSITTNTATFRGTSAAGLTEQQFLAWANSLTKTNNDYVFWNTTDSDGNVIYKRYKYNGTQWIYEYTLNNSSFTAAQWATVNSGMTSSDKTKLDGIEEGATKVEKTSDITNDGDGTNPFLTQHQSLANYSTTTQMNTAIANHHDSTKQNVIDSSHKLSADLISDGTTNKTVTQTEKNTWSAKSTVSVSSTGTSTNEVKYITVNGVEKKLSGGSQVIWRTF